MSWWFIPSIVLGVVALFFGFSLLLMAMFLPEGVRELFMSEDKKILARARAVEIATKYGVPSPPELHCEQCGASLSSYYAMATEVDGYDAEDGTPKGYRILARYKCPKGHFAGAPSNGKVYFTAWGKGSAWRWAL